jgi:hypothetical protein
MTVRRRRGIPRRVGTQFLEVWRLFKARFFYPRGPDVSRLATFTSASADAGGAAPGLEIPDAFTHRRMNPTRSTVVRPTVFARIVWAARFVGLRKFLRTRFP